MREIINQANPSTTLLLPEGMVGKTIEVIAFEIVKTLTEQTRMQRLLQIEELTRPTLTHLSSFMFDRNKANDYDE